MDISQLKSLQGIFPLVIEKYERFIPNVEGMGVPEKINSIIQYLNQIGKISNDVVRDWNKVMQWILDEGLNESVVANIESLIAAGRFDDLIQEALVEVDGRLDSVESSLGDIAKLSLKKFGAKGDGVTDDTQALLDCIVYAKANSLNGCYVPSGNYLINSSSKILIDFDSFTFFGDGENVSILRFNHADGGLLYHKSDSSIIYQTVFKNICISGNGVTKDLISMPDHMEELKVSHTILTNATNTIIKGGEIDLSWFSNCDITSSSIGVNLTNAGNLFFSNTNFFSLTKAFNLDGAVNSFNVRDSYFEYCDNIIFGTLNNTIISVLKFQNVAYLKNRGTSSPFYFTTETALDQVIFNEVRHIIAVSIPSVFEFGTKQSNKSVSIKMIENKFEQTVNGYLTYLIKTTSDSFSHKTILFLLDCNLGSLSNLNALVNGQAYVNVLDAGSIYVQTNDRGIKVNSSSAYAGRITYDTVNGRLMVTNNTDVSRLIPIFMLGLTSERPTADVLPGDMFFDKTLNKPIWRNNSNNGWIDSTGTTV